MTRPLFVLHPCPKIRARIQQAGRREFSPRPVDSWGALMEALPAASPMSMVVADAYLGTQRNDGPAPELRRLLRDFPTVAILAALELRTARLDDVRLLGEWGVVAVISETEHDVAAISQLLRSARGRPLRAVLEQVLPGTITARARLILEMAAEVATAGQRTSKLAKRLHVSARTLERWCTGAGLPPPGRVLALMRILLAAELLDDHGRSIGSIALACGYSAESGLRRTCYDFLGMNPTELRRGGAVATATRAFRAELAAH